MLEDAHVQAALRHFSATFRRTGSARATVKAFSMKLSCFPGDAMEPKKGELM